MTPQQRLDQASWLKILLREEFPSIEEFFLYGSVSKIDLFGLDRVYMTFNNNSDYDFAVRDSLYTKRELDNNPAFRHLPELDYQDNFTTHIYETTLDGCKVQVGLKSEFGAFKLAWGSVSPSFYWECINKRSPGYIGRDNVVSYINQLKYLTEVQTPKVKNLPSFEEKAVDVNFWQGMVVGL